VRCKPGFLLPVQVLSRLFRRLFLAALAGSAMLSGKRGCTFNRAFADLGDP
jgi:hypothetical protein